MKLHEYEVIWVDSWNPNRGRFDLPTKTDGTQRFRYYIILKRIRLRNNQVRLICQAYDETFFDREAVTLTPPTSSIPDPIYPFSYGGGTPVVTGDEIQLSFVKL